MAPTRSIPKFYQQQAEAGVKIVTQPVRFDLDQYMSHYGTATKYDRLLLIGRSSTLLGEEALQEAAREAKRRKYVKGFRNAVDMLDAAAGRPAPTNEDLVWINSAEAAVKNETKKLEDELKGYKNNLIKESIRITNEELGNHYRKIGQLPQAFKSYTNMREYCTGAGQNYNMSLNLILTAIEQRQWMSVSSQLTKLQSVTSGLPGDLKVVAPSIVQACNGLIQMVGRNYRAAAGHFRAVSMTIGEHFSEVLTVNDIAVYGGLCALASMTRDELQADILEQPSFRPFLELEPHIRQMMTLFCGAKYGACLKLLQSYRSDYLLDFYMRNHIDEIINIVKKESMIQYFQPFSSVSIKAMADAFGAEESVMRTELINMIMAGRLDARIDTQNGLILARERNERAEMQEEAVRVIEDYQRSMKIRLMRMNIAKAGLGIKSNPKKELGRAGLQRGASITDYTI